MKSKLDFIRSDVYNRNDYFLQLRFPVIVIQKNDLHLK